MKTAEAYLTHLQRIARRWTNHTADAEDLAHECLYAYHQRFGDWPWENKPLHALRWCRCKLRALAQDHAKRSYRRHAQVSLDAPECPPIKAPRWEADLLDNLAMEQFVSSLPLYLQRVARLYDAGHNYKEIAHLLGVSIGTVQGYVKRIARFGREFFGVDDHKTAVCVVNYSGNGARRSQSDTQEVSDDAPTAEVLGFDGAIVSDSELSGDAPHLGGAERTAGGGQVSLR
ncbi:MAG: hypothetical protein KatS3mg016_0770 [Fimbriimonadales bacterium]|nr:MAG: hypothetical protein KatS3mg016_0770 [Fimbriimonadales bacterium]